MTCSNLVCSCCAAKTCKADPVAHSQQTEKKNSRHFKQRSSRFGKSDASLKSCSVSPLAISAEQRVVVAVPGNAPPRRRGESLICQRIPEERPTKCQSRSMKPRPLWEEVLPRVHHAGVRSGVPSPGLTIGSTGMVDPLRQENSCSKFSGGKGLSWLPPALLRISLAAALHRYTAPRSAPSISQSASSTESAPGQKIQISEFPGSWGHNPGCRRVRLPWQQAAAGPFVSMRPHGGVLPTPSPDPPGRKTWVNPHIFGFCD